MGWVRVVVAVGVLMGLHGAAAAEEGPRFTFTLTAAGGGGSPAPWVLRVPEGYSPALVAMHQVTGDEFSMLALYPSFDAFVTGVVRCGAALCGDEVGVTARLLGEAPGADDARGMRAAMEADPAEVARGTVFEDVAVPPGYVSAFRATKGALPGRSYTASQLDYLVFLGPDGQGRAVTCIVAGRGKGCRTTAFDASTGLFLGVSLPREALDRRDAIVARAQALLASWRVR